MNRTLREALLVLAMASPLAIPVVVTSCLTPAEKRVVTDAEDKVSEAKAEVEKLAVTGGTEAELLAAKLKLAMLEGELAKVKVEAEAIKNARGVQLAEWFDGAKGVAGGLPYGQFVVPVLGIVAAFLRNRYGGA